MRSRRLAETTGPDELRINRPLLIGVARRAALLGLRFDPITDWIQPQSLSHGATGWEEEWFRGRQCFCPDAGCVFGVTTRLAAVAITALTEAISYHVYGMRSGRLHCVL